MYVHKPIHIERISGCRQQTQEHVFRVQIPGQVPSDVTVWHSAGLTMLVHWCSSIDIFAQK